MATPPEIKVRITGDSSQLTKEVAKAKKSIQTLGAEAKPASAGLERVHELLEQIAETSGKTAAGLEQANTKLSEIKDSTDRTATATENFTGSLRDEVKQAASVTAVLAFGTKVISQMEKDTGFLVQAFTGLTKEQRLAAEATKALNEEIAKGVGNAQAEVFALQNLIQIARDETRLKEDRQVAIDQINDSYPSLLENLSLETVATEDLDTAVQNLSKSLVRQAQIKAISAGLAGQYEELEKLLRTSGEDAATFTDKLLAAGQTILGVGNMFNSFGKRVEEAGSLTLAKQFFEVEKQIQATEKRLQELLKQDFEGSTLPDAAAKAAKEAAERMAKELEAGKKEADRILKDILKNYERGVKDLETIDGLIDREKAAENAADVAKIYEDSGARVKDALKDVGDSFNEGVEQTFLKIRQIEDVLASLKSQVSPETFDIISTFNIDQLKAFQAELTATQTQAKVFSDAVGAGFQGLALQMTQTISTGSAVLDALVASIVNSLASIAAAFIQQAITDKIITTQNIAQNLAKSNANAITIATAAAAALGPLGAAALPGLIASQLAIVNGAFAGIAAAASFAQGGIVPGGSFVGDKVPAYLNSGEMILNTGQQTRLFDILNGNLGRMQNDNRNTSMEVFGVIRGQDILLSNRRAERRNKRFS